MRDKKVKIIATLGPASDSSEVLEELALEGVDVFRINLSHQKKEEIMDLVSRIRVVEKKVGRPLAIMGDLAGPKIRIEGLKQTEFLLPNQLIKISAKPVGETGGLFSINYPSVLDQLKKGAEIYVDDGLIKLVVEKELANDIVVARVQVGGELKFSKGFHAQGVMLKVDDLCDKDRDDIRTMVELKADALAISFVQTARDIEKVRKCLPGDSPIILIAKIETQTALDNINEIIDAADGLMVARGDLGLSVSIAEVPLIQKNLISICLKKTKPVIIATQMLESMIHHSLPTRAEVTDVANAVLDGTDALMLSGETAVGAFPVQVVHMMNRIIKTTSPHVLVREYHDEENPPNAISSNAGLIADEVRSRVIVAFTQSGETALRISRYRHPQVIIALSPDPTTLRKLNFSWGIYPYLIEVTTDFDHMIKQASDFMKKNDILELEKGDNYVIVAGIPFGISGTTNIVYVDKV